MAEQMEEGSSGTGRVVLIAVDGSGNAEAAFKWALDQIVKDGDNVVCAHSAEYKVNTTAFGDAVKISEAMKEEQIRVGNLLAKYAQDLKQRGIKGRSLKIEGKKAGEAIVQAATDEKASIIITGTRGLGTVRRTIMGSVSDYIVHHAHCPVIIYRE